MSFPHSSRIAAMLLAGSCTLAGIPAVPTVAAETASTAPVRYEFENGTTSGGKIYQETWKGNTEEDGSGEDYDLTNASGGGFSLTLTKKERLSAWKLPFRKTVCMN